VPPLITSKRDILHRPLSAVPSATRAPSIKHKTNTSVEAANLTTFALYLYKRNVTTLDDNISFNSSAAIPLPIGVLPKSLHLLKQNQSLFRVPLVLQKKSASPLCQILSKTRYIFLFAYFNGFHFAGAQQSQSCLKRLTLKVPTSHTNTKSQ